MENEAETSPQSHAGLRHTFALRSSRFRKSCGQPKTQVPTPNLGHPPSFSITGKLCSRRVRPTAQEAESEAFPATRQISADSRRGLEITGREYHDGESMLKVRKSCGPPKQNKKGGRVWPPFRYLGRKRISWSWLAGNPGGALALADRRRWNWGRCRRSSVYRFVPCVCVAWACPGRCPALCART